MKYFAICGNVAVGKTTLAQALCKELPLKFVPEDIKAIPFLTDCYKDPSKWVFSTQVAFYVNSLSMLTETSREKSLNFCMDNTVMAHHQVFTHYFSVKGHLGEREYAVCKRLYECIDHFFPPPVLLVYLKGPVQLLLDRIKSRGREHEQGFTQQYLRHLDALFDAWIESYNRSPVLKIDAEEIVNQIDKAVRQLAAKFQKYIV